MPAREYRRTIHVARHGVRHHTPVGTWIKWWVYWCGRDAVLWSDNALWLDMSFMRCKEKRRTIGRVAETVSQYVDIFSSSLPAACVDLMVFDRDWDWLHVYSNFDLWVKPAIFERRLRTCDHSCCYINWRCVHVYVVPPWFRRGCLFTSPVPNWWHG